MAEDTQHVPVDLLDELAPRYRDISHYSRTGINDTYFAVDTVTGRKVNVSVLLDSFKADEVFLSRLTHAIRLHAPLNHPNILPLLDAEIGTRNPYYTTPHVDGRWLDERLKYGGALALDDVVNIVASVARALDYCQQSDVIHCDIKPHNVLLFDTHVAIHGFAIARRLSDGYDRFVAEGSFIGTFRYMSPERFAERALTASADLYSLGITAYECLFGTAPFPGPEFDKVIAGHLTEPPPVPSFDTEGERRFFDDIIVLLLAKSPDDRFSSATQLLNSLRPFSSVGARPPPPYMAPPGP
jgi:serine/threonine-protein kinase